MLLIQQIETALAQLLDLFEHVELVIKECREEA
jgi:hypothetical protein